jgi:hypothetical protein
MIDEDQNPWPIFPPGWRAKPDAVNRVWLIKVGATAVMFLMMFVVTVMV